MYYVYVLISQKDRKRYIGMTDNLQRRIREHNYGKTTSTKNRGPFDLVYSENFFNRKDARRREKYFKSGFGRKFLDKKILI